MDAGSRTLGPRHAYVLGRSEPPNAKAAAPLLAESATLFRKTGDNWGLAGPLLYLGRVARGSDDLETAHRLFSESAVLLQEVGDKFRLNLALHGLGDIARRQGNGPAARAFYTDALEASREMSQTEAIADAQLKLALTAVDQKEAGEARKLLDEAFDSYRGCGSTEGMTWVLEGFSRLAAQVGNPRLAAVLLGASEGRTTGGGIQLDRVDRERLEAELEDKLGMERLEAAQLKARR
jgi:tetratricopeptide (TPR) repeat protein